jgi:hypothetical protein
LGKSKPLIRLYSANEAYFVSDLSFFSILGRKTPKKNKARIAKGIKLTERMENDK